MITQTRLDRFFLVPQSYTPSRYSLINLPPSVRSQIYSYFHLTRDGHVHLNVADIDMTYGYEPRQVSICCCIRCQERYQPYNSWSLPISLFLPLLLTCRTFYQEICPILYSSNHFTISRDGPGGLGGLFSLRNLALASLTTLTIALNECKITDPDFPADEFRFTNCEDCAGWEKVECDDLFETASECIEHPTITSVKPLGSVSGNDRGIIREWNRLCKHIARCIPPNRLRLCLICDVKGVKSAQEIIKPMRQLPILSACSIRLSTEINHHLRSMAVAATRELTGRHRPLLPSSRLPQLPHEIQIQILQHTDLIAPHDLRWVPEQGLICLFRSPNERDSIWDQNPHVLNPCELCFSVHKPRDPSERQLLKNACASQCWCWRFPTELFLVNSIYHRDATRIFYSSNHFYIYGPRFIQQLPRDARRYLRSLQFLLPKFARWSERDWKEEILVLRRYVEQSRLTVTIDESLWRDSENSHEWSTEATAQSTWERAQGIVKPFMMLRGLKDFFVHLGHPTNTSKGNKLHSRREKLLEQLVMGRYYDSEERGKYLHRHRFYDPQPDQGNLIS